MPEMRRVLGVSSGFSVQLVQDWKALSDLGAVLTQGTGEK